MTTGTVVRMRRRGVEIQTSDPDPNTDRATQLEIYRVENGQDVVLGVGVVRRMLPGPGDSILIRLNPVDPAQFGFPGVQLGDLVRSMPPPAPPGP